MAILYAIVFNCITFLAVLQVISAQCPAVRDCLKGETCRELPVPRRSIVRPVSSRGFSLHEVRPGVFSFIDASNYRALILYKQGRLSVVGFPPSGVVNGTYLPTVATLRVLKGDTPARLDMVYSHRHSDHIGGAGRYFQDMKWKFPHMTINVWGTRETQRFIKRRRNSSVPWINIFVFKVGRTVNLSGTLELKLIPVGGHTNEDLACHVLPSSDGPGVMHFVDSVVPGFTPVVDFAVTIDLMRYVAAEERLLQLDWKFFSGGHGRMGRKRDMRINVQYAKDTIKFIREAAAEVTGEQLSEAGLDRVSEPTALEYGNGGFAFKVFYETQSKICARKLIRKYGCELGSVATFAMSHCVKAFFFNLVDA